MLSTAVVKDELCRRRTSAHFTSALFFAIMESPPHDEQARVRFAQDPVAAPAAAARDFDVGIRRSMECDPDSLDERSTQLRDVRLEQEEEGEIDPAFGHDELKAWMCSNLPQLAPLLEAGVTAHDLFHTVHHRLPLDDFFAASVTSPTLDELLAAGEAPPTPAKVCLARLRNLILDVDAQPPPRTPPATPSVPAMPSPRYSRPRNISGHAAAGGIYESAIFKQRSPSEDLLGLRTRSASSMGEEGDGDERGLFGTHRDSRGLSPEGSRRAGEVSREGNTVVQRMRAQLENLRHTRRAPIASMRSQRLCEVSLWVQHK